jgi:hypothetical protein
MHSDDEKLFAGWRPTETPPELGERVLAAVRRNDRVARPQRLEDRLWHSRGLRLGWIAATIALLAFNLWLPSPETADPRGMHAETGVEVSPETGPTLPDAGDRPSWSDQRMLLCKVLDDCARTTDEQTDGGRV